MQPKAFEKTSDGTSNTEPESSVENENAGRKRQIYLEIEDKLKKEISQSSRTDCVQRIKTEAGPFLGDKQQEIFEALDNALAIQDNEEFIARVSDLLRPLADMKIDDPRKYETIQKQTILDRRGYVEVNDLFAYGLGETGDYIHLHIFPVQERQDKLSLIKEGMRKLAQDVEANKNIKFVTATSWIVASNPRLLEMLGFDVEGPIDEETRKKYFEDDPRPISKAVISREKLLEKYL
jgi:PAS domain-containing protein